MIHASVARLRPSGYDLDRITIAAVIPAYNVEREIGQVVASLPSFVRQIIVVDDASADGTSEVVRGIAQKDPRIVLLRHNRNQGVGGAMVTGFREALDLGSEIIFKMDGDGQMEARDLPRLLAPLLRKEADYSKGNRFRDFKALARMPFRRRVGNMTLSFLAKAATGYWNCFDPTNGFVAIRREVLAELPLQTLDRGYFFEQSILAQLYLIGAVVHEVSMPARYGRESSHLSIPCVLRQFPARLVKCFVRRLVLKNFIYDFTMESLYLLLGLPMLFGGALFGSYHWFLSWSSGVPAHTGTVVIPAMLIILGVEFLLAAIGIDLQQIPKEPRCKAFPEDQAGLPSQPGGRLVRHESIGIDAGLISGQ